MADARNNCGACAAFAHSLGSAAARLADKKNRKNLESAKIYDIQPSQE